MMSRLCGMRTSAKKTSKPWVRHRSTGSIKCSRRSWVWHACTQCAKRRSVPARCRSRGDSTSPSVSRAIFRQRSLRNFRATIPEVAPRAWRHAATKWRRRSIAIFGTPCTWEHHGAFTCSGTNPPTNSCCCSRTLRHANKEINWPAVPLHRPGRAWMNSFDCTVHCGIPRSYRRCRG